MERGNHANWAKQSKTWSTKGAQLQHTSSYEEINHNENTNVESHNEVETIVVAEPSTIMQGNSNTDAKTKMK